MIFILKELEHYRHAVDIALEGPWGTAKDSHFEQVSYGEWVTLLIHCAEKGLHVHALDQFRHDHERAAFLLNSYRHLNLAFRTLHIEGLLTLTRSVHKH